jgi:hypothetical protein
MPRITVDMTNVSEGSGVRPTHQPPGDYLGKITAVAHSTAKSSGNALVTFTIQDVDKPSATYPYRCTLNAEALWKLRSLMVAAGVNAPKKKFAFDTDRLVGKEVGMTLEDDEYEGKLKSVIADVFPPTDLPEDEPTPKKVANKKPAAKAPVEEEDDEDLDELDIDDL